MILVSCAAAEVIVNPVAKYVFKTPQKGQPRCTEDLRHHERPGYYQDSCNGRKYRSVKPGKGQLEKIAPEFRH